MYYRLLRRNPRYARLWLAQIVSLVGDWFNLIAVSALVSRYTDGSGIAISGLLLARFLPPLIMGPAIGAIVDRFNRKWLLVISDMLRAIIVLGFLLANTPDRVWLIYLLTVLQFAVSALFEPARSAILPSVVVADDLIEANTLGSITWSAAAAVGALAGGAVAGQFGTDTALLLDAVTFALSGLLALSITVNAIPEAEKHERGGFREGLSYLRERPLMIPLLLVKFGGSLGALDSLIIVYGTTLFVLGKDGATSLGLLYGLFGVGAVVGPLLFNRVNDGTVRTMYRLIVICYGVITVGWILFGAAPTLIFAGVGLLVKAIGSSTYWTYSSVIIQKVTPEPYLGRMFSLDYAGFQLSSVVSVLLTGYLVEQIPDVRLIVFGTAVVSVIPFVAWALLVPWLEKQGVSV
jgi:MFS family permease